MTARWMAEGILSPGATAALECYQLRRLCSIIEQLNRALVDLRQQFEERF